MIYHLSHVGVQCVQCYCIQIILGLFIWCIISMSKATTNKSIIQSGQHLLSYKIILKIACITGVPNILAFTIVFVPNQTTAKEVLDVIYSIIYGGQGTRCRKIPNCQRNGLYPCQVICVHTGRHERLRLSVLELCRLHNLIL